MLPLYLLVPYLLILLLAVYGIVYAGLHLVCALVDAWEDLVLTWKAR